MTGMTKETEEKVNYIQAGIAVGMTIVDLAEDMGITKQHVSGIIQRYIPSLKKQNRLLPPKDRLNRSDLEKEQRAKVTRKKQNCKHTGYEWNLTWDDLEWPSHCPVLGLELDYFAPFRQENSISFDRIDSNKGYVKGNVKIISWRANRIKNDGTLEEHRQICKYLENT